MKKVTSILILIIISQFMCTSLWFAGNAVMPDLIKLMGLVVSDVGAVTSAVQMGFIVGTLFYSFFTIADRFKPSLVFFISALLGSVFNVLIVIDGVNFLTLLTLRFLTGFFLAGIYPIGMKIAADYFEKGLGKALSFLVGALVLGTALPHLITSLDTILDWKFVLYTTSGLAIAGGLLILFLVPEGPFRKSGQKMKFNAMLKIFDNRDFRAASFGYFGHMWELYTFWAFVPIMISFYVSPDNSDLNAPFLSFLIIGTGSLACIAGGLLSQYFGSKKIAGIALGFSGLCCLVSPVMFGAPTYLFIAFLIFWGLVVIADSSLFSALVAQYSEPELKGTALTIVTSIGFAISIVSIQLVIQLLLHISFEYLFLFLVPGPVFGLISLYRIR